MFGVHGWLWVRFASFQLHSGQFLLVRFLRKHSCLGVRKVCPNRSGRHFNENLKTYRLPVPGLKGLAAPSTPQPSQPPVTANVPETPTRSDDSIPATPKGEGLSKRASFIEVLLSNFISGYSYVNFYLF